MSIAAEHARVVFQKFEQDLLKLSSDQHAESVHRFRTGTRRLQTLLEELIQERNGNQRKLLKMLARIRKRTGKVRDLDVQLAALRSVKMPQEPRRKTQLMNHLIELRAKHERRLCKALKKEDVRDICKRLKRSARELDFEGSRAPLAVAAQFLAQVAPSDGPLTDELLHRYRMLAKRARYAAEFAVKSPEADRFIAPLKRIQDALGDWHDWLTLTETATKRLGDVRESSVVAVLRNVTGAKFRNAVAALPTSRSSLSSSKPPLQQQSATQKRQAKASSTTAHASSAA